MENYIHFQVIDKNGTPIPKLYSAINLHEKYDDSPTEMARFIKVMTECLVLNPSVPGKMHDTPLRITVKYQKLEGEFDITINTYMSHQKIGSLLLQGLEKIFRPPPTAPEIIEAQKAWIQYAEQKLTALNVQINDAKSRLTQSSHIFHGIFKSR